MADEGFFSRLNNFITGVAAPVDQALSKVARASGLTEATDRAMHAVGFDKFGEELGEGLSKLGLEKIGNEMMQNARKVELQQALREEAGIQNEVARLVTGGESGRPVVQQDIPNAAPQPSKVIKL